MRTGGYTNFVFINCPFDEEYVPMMRAIVYAVYRCGFYPKTALDADDATDNRLSKIIAAIKNSRFGIHDLSRIELSAAGFPRFNMPFELGIFFGAKNFGSKMQKAKNGLIFEKEKYSYQKYISDLNGIDTKAHQNNPAIAIERLRDWLRTASGRRTIPGYKMIIHDYLIFLQKLPAIAQNLGFDVDNLPFTDYCTIVEEVVMKEISR